jgi:ubiquitin-like 1-activating enzyme E1 A
MASLTAEEAKIYDRQLRVWGVDAQKKMLNARVLVVGLRGLATEIAKNLILAGIGHLTILEHEKVPRFWFMQALLTYCSLCLIGFSVCAFQVKACDLGANFFYTTDDIGNNRGTSASPRLQVLNPNVKITIDTENVASKPASFFQQFTAVCVTDTNLILALQINEHCRELSRSAFFYAGSCGNHAYCFEDLDTHHYVQISKEKKDGEMVENKLEKSIQYTSLADVTTCDLKTIFKCFGRRLKSRYVEAISCARSWQ